MLIPLSDQGGFRVEDSAQGGSFSSSPKSNITHITGLSCNQPWATSGSIFQTEFILTASFILTAFVILTAFFTSVGI